MPYERSGVINHQKVWLENFINLTILHHKYIEQGLPHPEIIFDTISNRLEECVKAPVCLVDQEMFNSFP